MFSGVDKKRGCCRRALPGLAKLLTNCCAIRLAGHSANIGSNSSSRFFASVASTRRFNSLYSLLPSSNRPSSEPGSTASSALTTSPVAVGQIFSLHRRGFPSANPGRV